MELNHLFKNNESGLLLHRENEEDLQKMFLWFSISEGERWGQPGWGHPLKPFLHEPMNENTEIMMEMAIFSKLSVDFPQFQLVALGINHVENCYKIQIHFRNVYTGETNQYTNTFSPVI